MQDTLINRKCSTSDHLYTNCVLKQALSINLYQEHKKSKLMWTPDQTPRQIKIAWFWL